MNELIEVKIQNRNGELLVSSRDIAKGLDKRHDHVAAKIREVLDLPEFREIDFVNEQGRTYKEYLIGKNAFILLVMNYTGYNGFKRAYIQKFDEMEKKLISITPKDYVTALRTLANEVEQKELMKKQRDIAIATKAWISDKKTATAMNTASQLSKKVNKLEIELDLAMSYATVKKVEIATGRKYDWRKLKEYCISSGLGWNKASDSNYGEVNSYPAEAWKNVYGVVLQED